MLRRGTRLGSRSGHPTRETQNDLERGQVDGSQAAVFRESLDFDPNSEVAENELAYIADLRAWGQRATAVETVSTEYGSPVVCARCGEIPPERTGEVSVAHDRLSFVCERCRGANG